MQKVLLVDDESSLRRSLSLSLNQEGYEVEPCENGINALKKLYLHKKSNIVFDTAIVDIRLPDIDGIKLGKIIKSNYPDTHIIFITGYPDNINLQEVQNVSTTRVFGKPFQIKDLTYEIEEIKRLKNISPSMTGIQLMEKEEITVLKTFSAYALLKLDTDADFVKIYQQLYFDKHVLYCDATNGEYGLCLLVQAPSIRECKNFILNTVKKIPGIKGVDFLEIANPILEESLNSILNGIDKILPSEFHDSPKRNLGKMICSYVLVEIVKEKMDYIYPTLCFDDNVVYCDYTNGKYNLVLLVRGNQFSEIEYFVTNKLAPMDGVLKVKKFPIISMFEM